MSSFAVTPVARRDLQRFSASCQIPGSATAFAIEENLRLGRSLSRVLVVDGRCLCKNNGIGNLFGDYVVWFSVAALSGRALFVDWTNSAGPKPSKAVGPAKNWTICLESGQGYACPRVPRRFDLSAHFATAGGRVWRWTNRAREAVAAVHGDDAESVIVSRVRTNPIPCKSIVDRLLGPSPWLTVRVADDTATAMLPHCLGIRTPRGAPAGKQTVGPPVARAFPDAPSVIRLLRSFGERLRAAGHERASREMEAAALSHGLHGRRMGSSLWSAPLVTPKASMLLRALGKPGPNAGRGAEARLGEIHAAFARGHGRNASAAGGVSADAREVEMLERGTINLREAEVPSIGLLTSCAMHAMLRPRRALSAHLAPLLARIGTSSLVTLQIRSGWADDSLYLGSKLAELLAVHPSDLLKGLQSRPRLAYMKLTEQENGSVSGAGGDGGAAGTRSKRASLQWHRSIRAHMHGRNASAIASARWAAITSTSCMSYDHTRDRKLVNSPCLDPSPAFLDARAQHFLRGKPTPRQVLTWRPATIAEHFRRGVPTPVDLPGGNTSRLAQVIRCAAHVAQAAAYERSLQESRASGGVAAGAAGGAAAGGDGGGFGIADSGSFEGASAEEDGGWQLYVSSDSPGLKSLLERLPALRGHVIGCYPRACSDAAHRAGQWRTPSAEEGLALAADVWMLGAADHTIAASSTTLVNWAGRAPPQDGRPQLLNLLRSVPRAGVSTPDLPNLGNKMVPICPHVPGVSKPGKCVDAEPNYERFPQVAIKPPPPSGPQDLCFASRFSLLSESAAVALEAADEHKDTSREATSTSSSASSTSSSPSRRRGMRTGERL